MTKLCIVCRQNVFTNLWWAAVLSTLRTTDLVYPEVKESSKILSKICLSEKCPKIFFHVKLSRVLWLKKGWLFCCGQFHQHYMRKFCVQTSFWQLFSRYMCIVKAAKTCFYKKFVRLTLMKLTPDGFFPFKKKTENHQTCFFRFDFFLFYFGWLWPLFQRCNA